MPNTKFLASPAGLRLASFLLLALAACGPSGPLQFEAPSSDRSLDAIEVPAGFDFATVDLIEFAFRFAPPPEGLAAPPRIRIGFPTGPESLDRVREGWLEPDGSYSDRLPIASWREEVAVEVEQPGGTRFLVLPIREGRVDYPGPALLDEWVPASGGFSQFEGAVISAGAPPAGIPEDLSNFPIAYVSYFPSQSTLGTIAFEDNWPSKGDYDFNDLVLAYQVVQYRNSPGDVVGMELFLKVEAAGADFANGFGVRLPVDPNRIISVSGNLTSRADATGLEPGQSQAVVIAFDRVADITGAGGMLNTRAGSSFIDVPTLRLLFKFRTPLKDSDLGIPPFDPFLIVNGDRGREVHLIGRNGTDLADPGRLGTGDDVGGYRTTTGLPWGLLLPEPWNWPVEKEPVHLGHLEFTGWAESGGIVLTDWYRAKGNNRNDPLLFQR